MLQMKLTRAIPFLCFCIHGIFLELIVTLGRSATCTNNTASLPTGAGLSLSFHDAGFMQLLGGEMNS